MCLWHRQIGLRSRDADDLPFHPVLGGATDSCVRLAVFLFACVVRSAPRDRFHLPEWQLAFYEPGGAGFSRLLLHATRQRRYGRLPAESVAHGPPQSPPSVNILRHLYDRNSKLKNTHTHTHIYIYIYISMARDYFKSTPIINGIYRSKFWNLGPEKWLAINKNQSIDLWANVTHRMSVGEKQNWQMEWIYE